MATRLVVFDLIGTTVLDRNDIVSRALRDALAVRGVSLRSGALDGVAGMSKDAAVRTLLEGHGRDDLLGDASAIHADFTTRAIRLAGEAGAVTPAPGAVDTFRLLRQHQMRVAIDTGFSRAVLDRILTVLAWNDAVVDATVASDEVQRPRPYPDMIAALAGRCGGIAPSDIAKVGDTPSDLHEGTMARCGLVVGVLSGRSGRQILEQHPHDALIQGVDALPALLRDRGWL